MRFNLNLENDTYKNLETVIGDFEKINAAYQQQKTEACDKFKVAFEAFMKDFFTLVPSIKQVRWEQYTPYFNDGDSCEFSMNEPYFANFIHDSEDDEDYDEDDDEEKVDSQGQWEFSSWELRQYDNYGLTEEQKKLVEYVIDVIANNEDFFYDMYGDHQQVTVTEKGIESDYYDHD